MEILSKIFAIGLTLSQITGAPDSVRTHFDPISDKQIVAGLLAEGCAHFRKVFDVEDANLDDLIATAMDDPLALMPNAAIFHGLDVNTLVTSYQQFCKGADLAEKAIDLGPAIEFYDRAMEDLPDISVLSRINRSGRGNVVDDRGNSIGEMYLGGERRIWVSLDKIPLHVRQAFVSAEDKGFFSHRGIDEQGLVRAFVENLLKPGRARGGSTITQQVVKNLLVGNDVTFERKIREMALASKVEQNFTKDQILELYLNTIYLGRRAWGVELAARSYFGKSVGSLTAAEGAVLAALAKGPTFFDPDRNSDRLKERFAYVAKRMQEDRPRQASYSALSLPPIVPPENEEAQPGAGSYFLDQVGREAIAIPQAGATFGAQYVVQSTLNARLQTAVESALQDGLAKYERDYGRAEFNGAEANLAKAIRELAAGRANDRRPAWQIALSDLQLPSSDVHWTPAIVIAKGPGPQGSMQVGLKDGRVLALSAVPRKAAERISLHDVVYVTLREARRNGPVTADLQIRPHVQGAIIVLDNKSGRILAMDGGFSYAQSQLNRTTQGRRQPGSAIKPLTYLGALKEGQQPTSWVNGTPITLPPIRAGGDSWSPKNYGGGSSGKLMLRDALARSNNLATVNLLNGSIRKTPVASLDYLCALALDLKLYPECVRYYPFVLGAQPVRPVDLAAFYATVANEGVRPTPHVIAKVTSGKATIFADGIATNDSISSGDRAAFYQLKTMLQGVLARGTASSIAHLAPYVAGKTGTTSDENDIWFVGFTNEVTVAVWMGYDNATGTRRTLGTGATGGTLAVPIFERVIEAVWASGIKKTPLSPASATALASLTCEVPGQRRSEAERLPECYRKDPNRNIAAHAPDGTKLQRRPRPVARVASQPAQQHEWKLFGGFEDRRAPAVAPAPRASWPQQQPNRSGFFFGRPW